MIHNYSIALWILNLFFCALVIENEKRKYHSVFIVCHLTHSFSVLCRILGISGPKKIFTTWVNSVTRQILWWGPRKEPPFCGTTTSWTRTVAGWGKWTSIQFTEDVQSGKELNGLQITGSQLHTRVELMSPANTYLVLISTSLKTDNSCRESRTSVVGLTEYQKGNSALLVSI